MLKCLPFLPIYRAATAGVAPLTPLFLYWRSQQGKEDRARLAEQFGKPSLPRPHGKLAWLHGASVGESVALLPLVEKLTVRGFQILLSTSTTSSAAIMAARLPAGSIHQYLPLDVGKYMAGFLDYWRPDLALIAESEIWPNLFFEARRRKIPMILVNARMSPRSFRRWRALAASCGDLLGCLDLCLAQSEEDAERFAALGAAHVLVAGNLKYDVAPPPADPKVLAQLAGRIGTRPHMGRRLDPSRRRRDSLVGAPCSVGPVAKSFDDCRPASCAPRSRDRRTGRNPRSCFSPAHAGRDRRSSSASLHRRYDGRARTFFRLAHIAFLGKSLVGSGGQNPIEAAKLGCAILHGPLVGNFAEVYKILDDARGACCIDNADTLARALTILLADAAKLRSVSRIASETVKKLGGASSTIMKTLEPHIAQLLINQCA